jgi:1-deoxy-D-xylulose-5-phosphate reductoisomerase
MVGFWDGSYMAHLGVPDMKIPITYAITYPKRMKTNVGYLDFDSLGSLDFEKADPEKYPCLGLAYQALSYKNSMAVAMNAANEICVEAFLDKRISFVDIPVIIEKIMEKHVDTDLKVYEDVLRTDMEIREKTTAVLGGL